MDYDNDGDIDFGEFFRTRVAQGLVTFEEDLDGYTEKSIAFSILISRSENDPLVKYKLHKLLGKGISGSVYSLITFDGKEECKDLVAKTFSKRKEFFKNEQKIMDVIAQCQNPKGDVGKLREHYDCTIMYNLDNLSDKFVKRVASNDNSYVIIYNRGEKLQRPITRQQFDQMFDCIRELRNIGIIHRDITPDHFLSAKASSSDDTGKIFLVSFSSAIYQNHIGMPNAISISTSHTEFLDGMFNMIEPNSFGEDEKMYTPHRRHDLESFVKTFYLLNNPEDIELLRNDADLETRIKCAHEYWHNFENKAHSFWREALEIARSDMIERLYNHLKHFQLFKVE